MPQEHFSKENLFKIRNLQLSLLADRYTDKEITYIINNFLVQSRYLRISRTDDNYIMLPVNEHFFHSLSLSGLDQSEIHVSSIRLLRPRLFNFTSGLLMIVSKP